MMWIMLAISALRRLRHKDPEFKVRLGYTERERLFQKVNNK